MPKGSWRTTTLGIIGGLTALFGAAQAYLDTDPATTPDWTALIAAITMSVGLIFARDNKVSSEEAGAK